MDEARRATGRMLRSPLSVEKRYTFAYPSVTPILQLIRVPAVAQALVANMHALRRFYGTLRVYLVCGSTTTTNLAISNRSSRVFNT